MTRLYFVIEKNKIREEEASFWWRPNFSVTQKMKNVLSFHKKLEKEGLHPLETSNKSFQLLGAKLSSFKLKYHGILLENVFQSSKVYTNGGPYKDLIEVLPNEAKRDERHRTSGKLMCFIAEGQIWERDPKTAFYDYLYLNAVKESVPEKYLSKIVEYDAFTDIDFNPKRSVKCEARSAALLKIVYSMYGEIPDWNKDEFIVFHKEHVKE